MVLVVGSALMSTACSGSGPGAATPQTATTARQTWAASTRPRVRSPYTTIVAQARVAEVAVYASPRGRDARLRVRRSQPHAPLIFVVLTSERGWLRVLLPVRPNGSSGWIRSGDVGLSQHEFHIVVELAAHRITVYERANIIDQEPIGVGKAQTPTPGGVYYTKELLQPKDPSGIYGPFAYQLSGFSDVVTNFNGGTGVIGIHGTNEPWLIGRDVSHGCIRMSNAGITRLAHLLPLGVPVKIRR